MLGVPSSSRGRALTAVIACICIYGVTTGLSLPLLSLILEARGYDRTLIGLNAAMTSLGTLLASPFIPGWVRRLGMRRFLLTCLFVDLFLFLSLGLFDTLPAWFAIRFLIGVTVAGLFVVSETWMNELATDATRGRLMGAYAALIALSFALGPAIIPLTGIVGWVPFLVGAVFIAVAGIPLLMVRDPEPRMDGDSSFNALSFIWLAPTLAAAVLLASFKDTATMSLLPIYGVRSGLSDGQGALMLTVFGFGAAVLQIGIGWVADHFDRRRVMMACAAAGGIGAFSLPLVVDQGPWLWIMLLLWGALFAGVYTVSLTLVGERFRGAELATANAAIGVCWGIGSLAGPATAGAAMDKWDPDGLPLVLSLAVAAFLILAAWRGRSGARASRIGTPGR